MEDAVPAPFLQYGHVHALPTRRCIGLNLLGAVVPVHSIAVSKTGHSLWQVSMAWREKECHTRHTRRSAAPFAKSAVLHARRREPRDCSHCLGISAGARRVTSK